MGVDQDGQSKNRRNPWVFGINGKVPAFPTASCRKTRRAPRSWKSALWPISTTSGPPGSTTRIDAAVAAAYAWPAAISEEVALARLLALNLERAARD